MTPAELKRWLGFPADLDRELRPEIIAGMADVPNPPPGPTDEHVRVFAAFLACAGDLRPSGRALFLPPDDRQARRLARRRQLAAVPKTTLVSMCRMGIKRPDGGRTRIEGARPLASWSKDDLINSVISVEFPAEPSEP